MTEHEFHFDWAVHTMLRLLSSYRFETVLDVGSGSGEHGRLLRHFGKRVFTVDLKDDADYVGDFLGLELDRRFDAVWCSHVLEHQRNVGLFLEKVYDALADVGVLALTVPIHDRRRLVSGHLSTWNAGLLCYHLVLAGFDCREARLLESCELGLIVEKRPARGGDVRGPAAYDEVAMLGRYFPFPAFGGAEAEISEVNWGGTKYHLPEPATPGPITIVSKNLPERRYTISGTAADAVGVTELP